MKKSYTKRVFKSAITGRFCSRAHAAANPDTTVLMTVRVVPKGAENESVKTDDISKEETP